MAGNITSILARQRNRQAPKPAPAVPPIQLDNGCAHAAWRIFRCHSGSRWGSPDITVWYGCLDCMAARIRYAVYATDAEASAAYNKAFLAMASGLDFPEPTAANAAVLMELS